MVTDYGCCKKHKYNKQYGIIKSHKNKVKETLLNRIKQRYTTRYDSYKCSLQTNIKNTNLCKFVNTSFANQTK